MKHLLSLIASIVALAGPALCATPEEAAAAYFRAFRAGNMHAVAALMHPDETTAFKDLMLPVIEKGLDGADDQGDPFGLVALAGGDTADILRDEAPEVFFTRFMTWLMDGNPELRASVAGSSVTPIGHVTEGDIAHVVYRMEIDVLGARVTEIGAVSLKRLGEDWMMMLTGEIRNMGRMLEANLNLFAP